MLKAKLTNSKNGRVYFIVGLEEENLRRLRSKQPIGIDLGAFDFKPGEPNTLIIMWGETAADIKEEINSVETFDQGIVFPGNSNKKSD